MKERNRTTTVISLWPRVCGQGSYRFGNYQLEAAPACGYCGKSPCRDHTPYSSLAIQSAMDTVDDGYDAETREKKFHTAKIDDYDIAGSIVENVKHFGVVAIEGTTPTPGELDEAKRLLDDYLKMTLEQEDKMHSAHGRAYNREHAVIACAWFGAKRDWMSDTSIKVGCPGCATMNPPNAIKCGSPTCGAILDWDKALEMGALTEWQFKTGTEQGRFSKVLKARAKASVGAEA